MLGYYIVFQHFLEPEGSIPNSQELFTCSYPEPSQSSRFLLESVLPDFNHYLAIYTFSTLQ
jgi:hypothetical protein